MKDAVTYNGHGKNKQLSSVIDTLAILHSLHIFLLLPALISAQDAPPTPVYQAQYASLDDKVLYIRGGLAQGTATATTIASSSVQQFYSLDLSPLLSNTLSNLSWKKLNPAGPFTDFTTILPMAVNGLNKGVTYFGPNQTRMTYDITTNSWGAPLPTCKSGLPNVDITIPSDQGGRIAIASPLSELLLIPHGGNGGSMMIVFDIITGECSTTPMPSTGIGKYFAWSVSKETGFMFGSALMTTTSSVWEFSFPTREWRLVVNQSNPPLLTGSCMVSAYGGNKLVIFGGSSDTARATGNIYIYDTIKYNWTTGTISLKPRADMACATSGDYFVVWGGYDNEAPANIPTEMLFYNMKTDKWANQTNISPEPGSVPDDNNDPVRSTKNNAPAIGGGVASVVLIAIIVGIVIIRRNRQQKRAEAARRHPQDSMSDSIIPPLPQPIRAESDASLLIAKISPDLNIPNAPHTSPSPTKISSSPHTALHHQVYEFTTERGPREEIELITRPQDPQYIPPPITSSLASLPRIETQSATSQPLQSPPLSAPQLYDISRPLDELPQVWLQPFNDPQYVEPPPPSTLLRTLDYARIQQEFPQPPLIANPQTSGPSSMRLINPLDRIAQVQEKYQRDLERLRKEQMAELEGIRKRWEDQKSRQVE